MIKKLKHITLFLLFLTNISFGQYYFNNVTSTNDFDISSINVIEMDKFGFIWIGTNNGLYRFDGTDLISLRHDPNDSASICEDYILSLFCDSRGKIWVGTNDKGVNIIDPITLKIKHIPVSDGTNAGLSSVQHKMIFEDTFGNIYISCSYTGFDVYNPEKQSLTNYKPVDQFPQLPHRRANCIISGIPDPFNQENIWLGSLHGIFKFNINSKQFFYYPIIREKSENPELYCVSEMTARNFLFLEKDELWYGSWGGGICRLNTQTGTFKSYKYEALEPVNGYRNNVKKIVRKSKNELWFAAEYKSLGVLNIETGETSFLNSINGEGPAVLHPSDIILTNDGQLFVSSFSNGLYFTQLNAHIFDRKLIPYKLNTGIQGKNNDFWAGTYEQNGKLLRLKLGSSDYEVFNYSPKENLKDNFFVDIINSDTCLWLVEQFNLYSFDFDEQKIKLWEEFNPRDVDYNSHLFPAMLAATKGQNGNNLDWHQITRFILCKSINEYSKKLLIA